VPGRGVKTGKKSEKALLRGKGERGLLSKGKITNLREKRVTKEEEKKKKKARSAACVKGTKLVWSQRREKIRCAEKKPNKSSQGEKRKGNQEKKYKTIGTCMRGTEGTIKKKFPPPPKQKHQQKNPPPPPKNKQPPPQPNKKRKTPPTQPPTPPTPHHPPPQKKKKKNPQKTPHPPPTPKKTPTPRREK